MTYLQEKSVGYNIIQGFCMHSEPPITDHVYQFMIRQPKQL